MSFATLMVHVDIHDESDARIRLADQLCQRFNARLIGISASAPVPAPAEGGPLVGAQLIIDQMQDIAARLAKCEERFRLVAGPPRSGIEWRSELDFPSKMVAQEARAADLLIVGRDPAPGGIYQSLEPSGIILKAGRPVLVVPPAVESLRAEHVVIGWTETREARRAVQDSLPFLHEATRVTIVEVCRQGLEDQARRHIDDVAHYLMHHRINVGVRIITHAEGPAAPELIRIARDETADLMVAGAYGHSRLGEWILGGVTRDLLSSCPVCCLFAH